MYLLPLSDIRFHIQIDVCCNCPFLVHRQEVSLKKPLKRVPLSYFCQLAICHRFQVNEIWSWAVQLVGILQ